MQLLEQGPLHQHSTDTRVPKMVQAGTLWRGQRCQFTVATLKTGRFGRATHADIEKRLHRLDEPTRALFPNAHAAQCLLAEIGGAPRRWVAAVFQRATGCTRYQIRHDALFSPCSAFGRER